MSFILPLSLKDIFGEYRLLRWWLFYSAFEGCSTVFWLHDFWSEICSLLNNCHQHIIYHFVGEGGTFKKYFFQIFGIQAPWLKCAQVSALCFFRFFCLSLVSLFLRIAELCETKFIFHWTWESFSHYFSKYVFYTNLFSLSRDPNNMNIKLSNIFSQVSEALFIFFNFFLFVVQIGLFLFICIQDHWCSSVNFSLLLNPHSGVFMSDIVFFSSKISIRFLSYFLFLCWEHLSFHLFEKCSPFLMEDYSNCFKVFFGNLTSCCFFED